MTARTVRDPAAREGYHPGMSTAAPFPPVTEALVRALPKTDLHCHLDGSLRLRTMLELAGQQGIRLPADSDLALFIQGECQP